MKNVEYSVLMSVYYKENPCYFRESVKSMLEQTIKPSEIIIVKDGKLTRKLEDIVEEFKEEQTIKFIALDNNVGLGEALNIGMKHCKNELVARMDTDDISKKDRCEKQLRMFLSDNSLSIVSSTVFEFSEDITNTNSIKKLPLDHNDIIKYAKRRNPFNHPSVMYRKSVVESAGGYKHFTLFEDYYLWARMIMSGAKCANIEEPLLYMRANSSMYKRRGGLSYFKCIVRFKWHLKSIGFISIKDFLVSASAQGIVSLLPNKMRIILYNKFLRTKEL